MRSLATKLALPLAALLLAGCADDRLAGNTTQTENTLARIRVDSLLPAWNHPWLGTTVGTLKLNASNFDFRMTDSTGLDLSVERDSGEPIPFDIVYWDKAAKLGRLQVRLDSTLLRPGAAFLVRWHQPIQKRADRYSVWQSIPEFQQLMLRSVLVDDFEGGTDTTRLPTRPLWATFKSDTSTITPLTWGPAGRTGSGKALSFDYTTSGLGYVVLKTPLVVGASARNLRSLDSLVFWAKGTRKSALFTAIEHKDAFKAWKHDTLDTAWTRICVKPSNFMAPDTEGSGNRGWAAVRDSATHLTFILSAGTRFSLDDVRLYGLDWDDLK